MEEAQAGRGEGCAQRRRCPLKCKERMPHTPASCTQPCTSKPAAQPAAAAAAGACSHLAVVAEAAGRSRAVRLRPLPPPTARGWLPPRRPLPARWVGAQGVGEEPRGQQQNAVVSCRQVQQQGSMDYLLALPAAAVPICPAHLASPCAPAARAYLALASSSSCNF